MKVNNNTILQFNNYKSSGNKKPISEHTQTNYNISSSNVSQNVSSTLSEKSIKELYAKATSESLGIRATYTPEQLTSTNYNGVWLNVDTTPPLNIDSKGDQSLNADQIKELSDKYDVTNLTPQEEYNLLQELTDLGVITKEEAMNTQIAIDSMPSGQHGITTKEGELKNNSNIDIKNMIERLGAIIHDELFLFNKVEKEYGERHEEALVLAKSQQKAVDILQQLQRPI